MQIADDLKSVQNKRTTDEENFDNFSRNITRINRKLEFAPLKTSELLGFVLTIDNLNMVVNPKSYSYKKQDQNINVTSILAVRNRIPLNITGFKDCQKTVHADEIPISEFLPTLADFELVKKAHKEIVKRILVKTIKVFNKVGNKVSYHFGNHLSKYSSQKSKTVNLGLLNEDENTIHGMVEILEHCYQYLPSTEEKKKLPIVIFGDGLTCDRIRSAQWHRMNSLTSNGLLADVVPGVASWHKRLVLLTDDFKKLLKDPTLTTSRGTLSQFRARFRHIHASLNIKTSFNASYDLLQFATNSYVAALAVHNHGFDVADLKINKLNKNKNAVDPNNCPRSITPESDDGSSKSDVDEEFTPNRCETSDLSEEDSEDGIEVLHLEDISDDDNDSPHDGLANTETLQLLDFVATEIVDYEWHNVQKAFSNSYSYCVCDEQVASDDWIGCENYECFRKQWYHLSCLKNLRNVESSLKPVKYSYRDLPSATTRAKKWYCCTDCEIEDRDEVVKYSKSLMYAGLSQAVFREAIRENHAELLLALQKIQLIQLYNLKHTTYLRICHRMLANINGAAPANIRHDLQHNSTVNIVGGKGKNISIDLFNEFANKHLKDIIQSAHGNLTPQSIKMRSRSFGVVEDIARSIQNDIFEKENDQRTSAGKKPWLEDIPEAVTILNEYNVFAKSGKRSHPGFENYTFKHVYVENILSYKEELKRLSTAMARVSKLNSFAN